MQTLRCQPKNCCKAEYLIRGIARSKNVGWTHKASAEQESITGVWGGVQDKAPGQRARLCPPEAETLSAFGSLTVVTVDSSD